MEVKQTISRSILSTLELFFFFPHEILSHIWTANCERREICIAAFNADHIKTHKEWRTCSISNRHQCRAIKMGIMYFASLVAAHKYTTSRYLEWCLCSCQSQSALLSVSVRMRTRARCTYYCIRSGVCVCVCVSVEIPLMNAKSRSLLQLQLLCFVY